MKIYFIEDQCIFNKGKHENENKTEIWQEDQKNKLCNSNNVNFHKRTEKN